MLQPGMPQEESRFYSEGLSKTWPPPKVERLAVLWGPLDTRRGDDAHANPVRTGAELEEPTNLQMRYADGIDYSGVFACCQHAVSRHVVNIRRSPARLAPDPYARRSSDMAFQVGKALGTNTPRPRVGRAMKMLDVSPRKLITRPLRQRTRAACNSANLCMANS